MSSSHLVFSPRPAGIDDVGELVRIEKGIHVAPWDAAHFRAELEKPHSQILVMTDDETDSTIAAYLVFWFLFDEAQILNVGVDLPHRGMGLAKALIRQVIGLALKRQIQKVVLDVRKSNDAAIQLYQSLKFTVSQVRKGFYSNGEDAYTMTLDLTNEPLSEAEKVF